MRLTMVVLVVLTACSGRPSFKEDNGSTFLRPRKTGQVSKRLEEASGLAASQTNPGLLWTLNDSGNPAELYLIDSTAHIRMTVTLQGIKNRDWEDLAVGTGPDNKKYVYVGDIGDNIGLYRYKYIYRLEEPMLAEGKVQPVSAVKTFVVELPDGIRDCETMMIDPVTQDLYLVSKRETNVHVYREPYPYAADTLRPQAIGTLPLTQVVAGSISPDGKEVLLKDYDDIYYWKMTGEKSIGELLATPPVTLLYDHEKQGEAMCWKYNSKGFYTLSESPDVALAYLRYYRKR
ncbi:MAG: hypothetical protein JSS79_12280 [Bacteroidetes bacterium]|nr:hypothetical protein [Bacteroidota bacterium]